MRMPRGTGVGKSWRAASGANLTRVTVSYATCDQWRTAGEEASELQFYFLEENA